MQLENVLIKKLQLDHYNTDVYKRQVNEYLNLEIRVEVNQVIV